MYTLHRSRPMPVLPLLHLSFLRRSTLWRTLRLMEAKKRYDGRHQCATELQNAWLGYRARRDFLPHLLVLLSEATFENNSVFVGLGM